MMDGAGIHPGWFIGACVAAISGVLLWWGNNRYFAGRFDQWQSDVKERFDRLNERLEGIEEMRQRMSTCENETARNRDIRHDVIGMRKAFEALMDLMKHKI